MAGYDRHTSRNVKKGAGHLDRQVLPFTGPNEYLPVLACFLFIVLRNCAFFLPDIWTGRSSAPAGPNANLPVRTGGPAHFAMYARVIFLDSQCDFENSQ